MIQISLITPSLLLEIRLNLAILHSINHQLKDQICALDLHVQLKVQVRELLTFASRQSSEQALWDRGQIRSELADIDQILVVSVRCNVVLARDEIVFDDQ